MNPVTPNLETITTDIIAWIIQDRQAEQLAAIELTPGSALLKEDIFDSMKILQFVAWLEQNYGISIGVESLTAELFESPRAIAAHVLQLQAQTLT